MDINNLLKICIKALLNNKTRCFLTMLGIIIGVAAVIAMLAIGNGSKQSIRAEIGQMGSNMIMVSPGNGQFGGVRQSGSSMQTLKLADYACRYPVISINSIRSNSGRGIVCNELAVATNSTLLKS